MTRGGGSCCSSRVFGDFNNMTLVAIAALAAANEPFLLSPNELLDRSPSLGEEKEKAKFR